MGYILTISLGFLGENFHSFGFFSVGILSFVSDEEIKKIICFLVSKTATSRTFFTILLSCVP